MNALLKNLADLARQDPARCALKTTDTTVSFEALWTLINQFSSRLNEMQTLHLATPVIALAVENHPAWVVMDCAAMQTHAPLVPIPFFFRHHNNCTQWKMLT